MGDEQQRARFLAFTTGLWRVHCPAFSPAGGDQSAQEERRFSVDTRL